MTQAYLEIRYRFEDDPEDIFRIYKALPKFERIDDDGTILFELAPAHVFSGKRVIILSDPLSNGPIGAK